MAKKSWAEKMLKPAEVEVKVMEKDMGSWGKAGDRLLIPTPEVIRDYVRGIPAGEGRSVVAMRADLAQEFGAEVTCPLTTGIFLRVVSEAAFEEVSAGAGLGDVAPFWRVVEPGSALGKKLACGVDWRADD
jgi:pantoate kinase